MEQQASRGRHPPQPEATATPANSNLLQSAPLPLEAPPSYCSGSITTVSGAHECLELSVQLQEISKVLFIDAGNIFNPYYLHRTFRGEVEIREALSNISISRPFTIYQLRQAIFDIEKQLDSGFRVLIISCIDDMFYDDGLDREEAKQVFLQTIAKLREIVSRTNCYCFISFIGKYYRKMHEEGVMQSR